MEVNTEASWQSKATALTFIPSVFNSLAFLILWQFSSTYVLPALTPKPNDCTPPVKLNAQVSIPLVNGGAEEVGGADLMLLLLLLVDVVFELDPD
tara:strand:- start:225 stop:509 length:285 start_codon:yes stop_codon:yes gene_type:complete